MKGKLAEYFLSESPDDSMKPERWRPGALKPPAEAGQRVPSKIQSGSGQTALYIPRNIAKSLGINPVQGRSTIPVTITYESSRRLIVDIGVATDAETSKLDQGE